MTHPPSVWTLRIALLVTALTACTTSFDVTELPSRTAVNDAGDRPDLGGLDADSHDADMDTPQAPDGPDVPDVPAHDAPVGCGAAFGPCCSGSGDAGAAACTLASRAICSQGVCVPCAGTLSPCDGVCVDTQTNALHCGRCGARCMDGYECRSGSCRLACAAGLTECGGRCVSTLLSTDHCGMCNNRCAAMGNAASVCNAGTCMAGSCQLGFADCDMNTGNGCETDTRTSAAHCGACMRSCARPHRAATCAGGACVPGACEAGYMDCDGDPENGCEVNVRTSTDHCGRCANACPAPTGATAVCANGTCGVSMVTCPAGRGDCNNSSADGCEVDLTTAANCGRCGAACAMPNATSACASGQCRVMTCATGFLDCDMNAANGCEADVRSNASQCGSCTNQCATPRAVARCVNMVCDVEYCEQGWGNCDGSGANGCEVNLNTTVAHCGTCGNACRLPHAAATCTSGQCQIMACEAGWGDCDRIAANGCELDLQANAANCGVCGTACFFQNATAACSGGACGLTACGAGFANCDMSATNGCEVNTQADAANCGACGRACMLPNVATARCVGGQCAVGACGMGFADCDVNAANGCEVNTQTDAAHCGMCGRACAAGQVCSNGQCQSTCTQTMCGASCVNLTSDPMNCGMCGRACPGAANAAGTCVNGACGLTCNAGFGNCDMMAGNGCERSLTTSNDCGACGTRCASGTNQPATCATGTCVRTCNPGYGNCDGDNANGCEVNTSTSEMHCGACGARCTTIAANASPFCNQGTCQTTCNPGFRDCDMSAANGCESRSSTDPRNCGACGNDCTTRLAPPNTMPVCASSVCAFQCTAGFADCDRLALTGCEVNLSTDRFNCGRCGNRCTAGANTCASGTCR